MKKIGIFGGAFDPITSVHLSTANTIAHRFKLDQVIFLPSSSKRDDKTMQIKDEHRWNMVEMAIRGNDKFTVDNYEMKQEVWNISTYNTMKYYKTKYPDDDLYFIMGADLLKSIGEGRWGNDEKLVKENKFIVMNRDDVDLLGTISKYPILRNNDDGRFHLFDKGVKNEVSSTYIRDEFAFGGDPRYFIPDACYEYILEHNLYRWKKGVIY